jgi:hypothetical protein
LGALPSYEGLQVVDNGDGTITFNGKQSSGQVVQFNLCEKCAVNLPAGTYQISGCPQGGANYSYSVYFTFYGKNGSTQTGYDYGSGASITVS